MIIEPECTNSTPAFLLYACALEMNGFFSDFYSIYIHILVYFLWVILDILFTVEIKGFLMKKTNEGGKLWAVREMIIQK
jgi:hypothetical protein